MFHVKHSERKVERMKVKSVMSIVVGLVGAFVTHYLGGWDMLLDTLIMFMVLDYATGLYIAGVLHKSPKTETGRLSSEKGYHGIVKKLLVIMFVAMMYRLDMLFNIDYLRNGTIIAFLFQEGISIIENAGICGLKIPEVVKNGIDLLNQGVKNNEDKS